MTLKPFILRAATAALVSGSVLGPHCLTAQAAGPPAGGRPVLTVVRLDTRPDVLAAFGFDIAGFHAQAAQSLSRSATEEYGPLTPEVASRIGRDAYYRPQDVELYAVPSRRHGEARGSTSYGVIAVPLYATVHADGSVSPPTVTPTGLVDPTFSNTWGFEEYFNWTYFDIDDGGLACNTTKGEIRGQWEYARLANVSPSVPYDYWGFAQRSVAEITQRAPRCRNTIDRFETWMQFRVPGAYPAHQSPLSMPDGKCVPKTLTVGGTFNGVSASISQTVERCERWIVKGALAASAADWYGISYDNKGAWNKLQRESGALEIVRVPRGGGHLLNTTLDLDVDNRRL